MAIIYTYPTKSIPNANDLILISDSQDSNKTKQVKIASLPGGSGSGVSSVTSSNAAITVADASTTPVLTSVAYTGTTNIGHVPTGGSATTFLKGDGTWATPTGTPGGSTTQFQYNQSGNFLGTNLLRFDADAIHVGIAGGTPEQGKVILYSDGTATGAPTIELKNSANAHGVTIKGSPDAGGSADYDFILPIANGTSGQYLKLNSNLELEYTNIPTYPVTTYSSGINNRVITATSTSAIQGEQYLTFDGVTLTVADANSDVKITGNGISFPGQTDEMNDYEEGTWTPAPYDSGGNPTTSIATGTFIKVGDLVNCYFYLNITSSGSTPGAAMVIQGLPFASNNTNGQRGGVIISRNDGTNFVQQQATSGLVEGSNLRLKRILSASTTSTKLTDASWYATASLNYILEGTVIYKV